MKNTTGLYKHQRDNNGRRRRLPAAAPKAKLVPVTKYEYEKARESEFNADLGLEYKTGFDGRDE